MARKNEALKRALGAALERNVALVRINDDVGGERSGEIALTTNCRRARNLLDGAFATTY